MTVLSNAVTRPQDAGRESIAHNDQSVWAVATRFTAHAPKTLSKQFGLAPDGTLTRGGGGALSKGVCEVVSVATPSALASVLETLTSAQALSWGVPKGAGVGIEREVVSRSKQTNNQMTRTRDHFDWAPGAGWLMLDYDPPKDAETPLTRDQLRDLLTGICPALADAPMVMADSASSWIYRDDECLVGQRGLRAYVLVADARDIKRAGEALFDRAWLAGHGFYLVSKSGQLLRRGPIDYSVWQPERLDFAGGAVCRGGLVQRRPAPTVYNDDADPLNTCKALPDLTATDREALKAAQDEAAAAVRDEQEETQREWITAAIAQAIDGGSNDDEDAIGQRLADAVENKVLHGDFDLLHHSGKRVTVADLLKNAEQWHGERFADPLEPDYRDDKRIAWANLRSGGRPYIYSHAHGGTRYRLQRGVGTLRVAEGEKPRLLDECDLLMQSDGAVYQRGGLLVRTTETHGIRTCTTPWVRTYLEQLTNFVKFDKRMGEWIRSDAPEDLAKRYLANVGAWGVPELRGVIHGPILRDDGSLLHIPGYDKTTGLLLLSSEASYPAVPVDPTPDQVRAALEALWEPFAAFPYVDDLSRGVQLAALLTAVQRPILPTAPAFGWNAYRAGSGKSKAAKATGWLSGSQATESPWSDTPEEQRKKLMSVLLAGPQTLLLDNISSVLKSDVLCAILTSEHYSDRKLGVSEDVSAPTQVLVMATGNNLSVAGDLSRRILIATIDHGVEHPERLSFGFDPVARARERWLQYRTAALTVLRGFYSAGAPAGGPGRMGSYEAWDAMIRQCVVWVRDNALAPFGLDDPMLAVDQNWDADPETRKLTALMDGWASVIGTDRATTVAELIRKAGQRRDAEPFPHETGYRASEAEQALPDALDEIAGEGARINPRRLGRWIERHAGRIVNGRRFVKAGGRSGVSRWALEIVRQTHIPWEQVMH